MTYAQRIADYVAGLKIEDIPESTRHKASLCLIDYLAAAWNAQGHPLAEKYVRLAMSMAGKGSDDASAIGLGLKLPPAWAAFANAAQGHITETDDGHRTSIMHIGTVVIPVVLALAESRKLTGARIMEALVCGYDVAIRSGECFGPEHYGIFHTTATAGTFGAAAAAAKAMNLSPQAVAWALGHAGTQASGLWQFLNENAVQAKPFHPAKAALAGMISATLAESGIEGAVEIFEGEKGFCAIASKKPQYDALVDKLGSVFKIDEVNFKGYPTCGQTHSMLDAMAAILSRERFLAEDVAEVEARVYQRAVDIAGIPDPETLEEAKFSNQFCLAFMISRGTLSFMNFTEEAMSDHDLRRVANKIRLVVDPEMDAGFPAARPCRITVRLNDGRSFSQENKFRKGDPENPMDAAAMQEKFAQLTEASLGDSQRRQILDWCLELEKVSTVEPWIFEQMKE